MTHPFAFALSRLSEAKAPLKFNDAPGQPARRDTEILIVRVYESACAAKWERLEVQDIEDVEEVGPDLKIRSLVQEVTQPEPL